MNKHDMPAFFEMWGNACELYGKELKDNALEMAFKLLRKYELPEIESALKRHMVNPGAGRFMPQPADVVRWVEEGSTNKFPGAEEAWAMYPRSEEQTACVTQEMHRAWSAAADQDAVAGRMAFKEVYNRAVRESEYEGRRPVWVMTIGHDPVQREEAVLSAVERRAITADAAKVHLPGYDLQELQQLSNGKTSINKLISAERRQPDQTVPRLISETVNINCKEVAEEQLAKMREILDADDHSAHNLISAEKKVDVK